jgi:hypothetical protein
MRGSPFMTSQAGERGDLVAKQVLCFAARLLLDAGCAGGVIVQCTLCSDQFICSCTTRGADG